MKDFYADDDVLQRMRVALPPAYFVGTVVSMLLVELMTPDPDTKHMIRLLNYRQRFIEEQRSNDQDDGLIREPLFWTDLDPDLQDEESEVLACAPICQPFLLCSSIEPHARWAVVFSDEDRTPMFFRDRESAVAECEGALEAGRKERAEAVEKALDLNSKGYPENADAIYGDWLNISIDRAADTITVDGVTEPLGKVPEDPKAEIVEQILTGNIHLAEALAVQRGLELIDNGSRVHFAGREFERVDRTNLDKPDFREVTTQPVAVQARDTSGDSPLLNEKAFHPHPAGGPNEYGWIA